MTKRAQNRRKRRQVKSQVSSLFSLPSFPTNTAIATTAGARQLAPTPAEGRGPTPTVGLVGASHCGTRPNVARPQATQRASDAPTPAFIHVDRERNQAADSTPRSARRTLRCNQRFAGHGEMGDRGPVAPLAASGWWEPSLAPTHHHSTLAFSATRNHTTHAEPTDHHDSITSHPASAQSPRAGAAVAKSTASRRGRACRD